MLRAARWHMLRKRHKGHEGVPGAAHDMFLSLDKGHQDVLGTALATCARSKAFRPSPPPSLAQVWKSDVAGLGAPFDSL